MAIEATDLLYNSSARPQRDRRNIGFLCLLVLMVYLPSAWLMLGGSWPFADDAPALFGPWRNFAQSTLRQGVLPLWNPHSFCGLPFMANGQTAVLYPLNIVYWWLPIKPALWLDALLHNWLLIVGAYVLARRLNLSRTAATLTALCMGLGASVAAHIFTGHMTWHAARAWLPWEMWALLCYLQSGRLKYALLLAACFALQIAAGYPPLVLMGAALCSGVLVVWILSRGWRRRTQSTLGPLLPHGWLSTAVLTIVLTATLSAVWILPLREVSALSVHGSGLHWEEAVRLSGTWKSFVRWLLPMFFNGNQDIQWSLPFGAHEEAAYIGLLPLLLALGAPLCCARERLSVAQRHAVLALWLLLWIAAILALGQHTPLYGWIFEHLAPFRLFRIPVRWLELWYLCAALLVGYSWQALFKNRPDASQSTSNAEHLRPEQRRAISVLRWLSLGVAMAIAALGCWLLSPLGSSVLQNQALLKTRGQTPFFELAWQKFHAAALGQAGWSFVLAMGLFIGLGIGLRRLPPRRLANALLLFVAFDLVVLFFVSLKYDSRRRSERFVQWPAALQARYEPGQRWSTFVDWRALNQNLPLHLDLYNGYDAMNGRRYFEFASAAEERPTWSDMYQPKRHATLFRVAGVTHLLTNVRDWKPPQSTLAPLMPRLTSQFGAWKLWRYDGTWPRIYLSRRVMRYPEAEQLGALRKLANETTAPFPVVMAPSAFPAISAQPRSTVDKVLWWQRDTNQVRARVQTAAPSVLVIGDALAPGWRAWVNGKPASLEEANYLFRGVQVPRGQSQVAMVYEPQSYRFGLFVSLCALSMLSALSWVKFRSRAL
jgi:hypothetical protein